MQKFGIYIHFPYCLSKCPYCDFASVACRAFDEKILRQGYFRDLDRTPKNPVSSIFFGGGTPSMMSVGLCEDILNKIAADFTILPNAEITMEANPDAIDEPKMRDLKRAGINRLSLGVQALNDADLKFLGRLHNSQTAILRIEQMMRVFDNCSVDLIYARPNQDMASWKNELGRALEFGLPHLSLYELTIEEGTAFYRKNISACDEQVARDLYLMTLDMMQKADRPAYEVSNFALKGYESRHNLLYWQGDDYAGIGPAAHGRLGLTATSNPKTVGEWMKAGTLYEQLTQQERAEEKIMMGLRLFAGMSDDGIDPENIQKAVQNGWLCHKKGRIIPTIEGILMLNPLTLLLLS